MTRFLEHYSNLMEAIVASPQLPVTELQFLSQDEIELCQKFEAGAPLVLPGGTTFLNLFRHHQDSSRFALLTQQSAYSYSDVEELSNKIALKLQQKKALPNHPIALFLERSALSIIALLGILKSGAPYVAIDIDYPEERIHFILEDAKIKLILTSQTTSDNFAKIEFENGELKKGKYEKIIIEEVIRKPFPTDSSSLPSVSPENLAYLIYTSGSSGKPKAVAVTHKNLLASTQARLDYYGTDKLNFLLIPDLTFDSSVAGLFWTLATGGTLIVATSQELRDPDMLCQLIQDKQVQAILSVPSLYEQLLSWQPERLQNMSLAIVAGEACLPGLVTKHHATLPNCVLYNEYGPTEATVWASVQRCEREQTYSTGVPIGQPIPGAEIRILDSQKKRRPIGFIGQLCIGGLGVSLGYPNNPDLTNANFFTSEDGKQFYASGDLASWTTEGALQYHGRNDEQIKIRGYRIELSEIEKCLRSIPGVKEASVITTSRKNHYKTEQLSLDQLLDTLPQEIVTEALAAIGTKTNNAKEVSELSKKVKRANFEFDLTFKHADYINPPRKAQRDWLINQSMYELADDLEHLNFIAPGFVPGKDHQLGSDLIDISQSTLSHDEIMENWQTPLMKKMANFVSESHGDILEIGFGRGVSASFVQENHVNSHTIIEMNGPCIENYYKPWLNKYPDANISIHQSRWQDCLPTLGQYDGILFHAYPMNENEFIEYILKSVTFAEHAFSDMAKHLRKGGIFTYLTTEVDSISRRHQRALLKHFSQLSFEVVSIDVPADTIDSWWAESMVSIKAIK